MSRTTISLPDGLLRRLRIRAAERGTSMAKLIREAVEKELAGDAPCPRSLGIAESGQRYTSEEASNVRPKPR
jgi:plasmid stability protein